MSNGLDPDQDRRSVSPDQVVIKLVFILRLKIERDDWLFADTCPQAANHCGLF